MLIRGGQVFDPQRGFSFQDLGISDGRICAPKKIDTGRILDASGLYIIPGLIDLHSHGAMGADFSDASAEAFETIARYHLSQGITSFLACSLTLPLPELQTLFNLAGTWMQNPPAQSSIMRGIYMEGPFFSPLYAGAQDPAQLLLPKLEAFESLWRASKQSIKALSLAPELPGALALIEQLSPRLRVALGHSACNYQTAMAAFDAGASLVSHLYNAMAGPHHREPGLAGAAFDASAFVELIADGHHLHPSVLRSAFKLYGAHRVVLISDSMRATGMPPGQYRLGGLQVTVQDGKATLANGRLAGSSASLLDCARNALAFGIALEDVVRACTYNPAVAAGLDGEIGSLAFGHRADLLLINARFEIQAGFLAGVPIKF